MKDLKAVIVEGTNAWVLFDGEEEIAHGIIHQGEVFRQFGHETLSASTISEAEAIIKEEFRLAKKHRVIVGVVTPDGIRVSESSRWEADELLDGFRGKRVRVSIEEL